MFKITQDFSGMQKGRGFQITFSNSVTISVQFGYGNYCTNRDGLLESPRGDTQSPDAEVALFGHMGNWLTREALIETGIDTDPGDDVMGYVTPDQVALLVAWAAGYNSQTYDCSIIAPALEAGV